MSRFYWRGAAIAVALGASVAFSGASQVRAQEQAQAQETACQPCAPVAACQPCEPCAAYSSCQPCVVRRFFQARPCCAPVWGCVQPCETATATFCDGGFGETYGANVCDCWGRSLVYVPAGVKTPLFNGVDLTGWTNVKGDKPGDGWKVVDGEIFRESNAGDLYANGKFENFVLEFEFKVSEKGNSGVKYRSWNTEGFGLGCEYQIYDDINDEKNPPRYHTASLYDVIPPREGTGKIKMGEFNRGKIIVAGNHIEHYLNDELIVSVDVGSKEWRDAVAKSKFKDVPEFGTTTVGRIFLQDHNCQVWFKNLYVTKLTPVYERRGLFGCVRVYR